ncbi:hypothetical protein KO317_00595 [Candidatus Micrarchaeota archaeon]|jgi:rRNA-processing protein FCF1|nr:hypothetical protein [Candidatus Micrarchaeota archaeon]
MKIIIIDTNFFFLMSSKKIDIFKEICDLVMEEHKLVVTSKILTELQTLSKRDTDARFGLKVLNTKINEGEIRLIENIQHPDEFIAVFAKNNNLIVCTNDADLRKKAKKAGAKVISLRANKRINFI